MYESIGGSVDDKDTVKTLREAVGPLAQSLDAK